MPKPGGLFAMMGGPPPEEDDEEDTLDDFSDDLAEPEPELEVELGAGPLDAYMETVFDEGAPMPDRIDAFRQAILTVVEERERGG
jgi:hypothetical protein